MIRHAFVTLVTTVSVSVLGACSDEPESTADDAGSVTTSAGTSAPTSGETSADPGPDAQALLELMEAGIGSSGSARFRMRTTGVVGSRASGSVDYGRQGSRIDMTTRVDGLGGPTRVIVTPEAAYVDAPGMTPQGKFIRLDQSDPRMRQFGGGQVDPRDSLSAFRDGLQDTRKVGEERIGGVDTAHYRLTLDAAEALEAQGQTPPPGVPSELSYDVWLDPEGRMRRMTTKLAGSRVVVEFEEWGEPVSIEAPAPADVVEAP